MMLNFSRARILSDYLAATRNEIAVDEMFLALICPQSKKFIFLPRVPHWVQRGARMPKLVRLLSHALRIIWIAGGAALYFSAEWVRYSLLRYRTSRRGSQEAKQLRGAVLAFSTRVCDVVRPELFPSLPTTWLTCPWATQHALPHGAVELPLLSLVHRRDLREAFIDAIRATYLLAGDLSQSKWVLQSYTAFRWFLTRRAIDRISGTLVTAEHFDRWAVLADRSVRATCRLSNNARRLVLVQHGALGGLGKGEHGRPPLLPVPTKLHCVDELYTYSPTDEQMFRSGILAQGQHDHRPLVHYFKPSIQLTGNQFSVRPRILFVGHPICEDFHIAFFRKLQDIALIEAYYKPHPKAQMSPRIADAGWRVIKDSQVFPRVELLVSYPSTLVIEYEGAGVPAVVHSLDAEGDEIRDLLMNLQRLLGQGEHRHSDKGSNDSFMENRR